jgi:hypothetical protein
MLGAERLKMTILPGDRVSRKDAAMYLGRKPTTLGNWVKAGRGPKPVMIGGRAFYSLADLDAFICAGTAPQTPSAPPLSPPPPPPKALDTGHRRRGPPSS